MSEPQRYPTRDELDYAARKEAGFPGLGVPATQSQGVVTALNPPYAVEDNDTSAYLGVAPEYMTYAEDLNKPFKAEGSADDEAEVAREEKLISQTPLVAPRPATPEANQTEGGGSTQETVGTALSGENFSSEIAKPVETETVEVPTADGTGQLEVGVSGGSTGQTTQEAAAESVTEAQADVEDSPATTSTASPPRPAKRTSSTS